jgi:hypothetical protein
MQYNETTDGDRSYQSQHKLVAIKYVKLVLLALGVWMCVVDSTAAQAPTPTSSGVKLLLMEPSGSAIVDVIMECDIPSCDAVALQLTFAPDIVQVVNLTKGAFLARTGNVVHVLREKVDNSAGAISFVYVTQDGGYAPFSGTGTLLTLTVAQLKEGNPEFKIASADVASIDGQTVFHYVAAIAQTAAAPHTLMIHVQTEAPLPENIIITPLDNADLKILRTVRSGQGLDVEFDMSLETAAQNSQRVMIAVPGHLACFLTLTDAVQGQVFTLKAGDVNRDGVIDIRDAIAISFGNASKGAGGDINGDGQSNILDLIYVGRSYGAQAGECAR